MDPKREHFIRNIQCMQKSMEICILVITKRYSKKKTWLKYITRLMRYKKFLKIFNKSNGSISYRNSEKIVMNSKDFIKSYKLR